jgi:hypothetical protein
MQEVPAGVSFLLIKIFWRTKRNKPMAVPAGLEPATRGVEIRYSIQLSYGTVAMSPALGRFWHPGLLSAGEPNHGSVHSTVNMKNPLSRKVILRTESDE